jgi:hypothetical protein
MARIDKPHTLGLVMDPDGVVHGYVYVPFDPTKHFQFTNWQIQGIVQEGDVIKIEASADKLELLPVYVTFCGAPFDDLGWVDVADKLVTCVGCWAMVCTP